jgi:hypothetical protein
VTDPIDQRVTGAPTEDLRSRSPRPGDDEIDGHPAVASPRTVPGDAGPSTGDGPIDVVFIGGASRTGSTLLSLLLGSLPGYFAAGELRYLWLRGVAGDQLCECGDPFRSCVVWRRVIERGLGPLDAAAAESYAELWSRTARVSPVLRSVVAMDARSRALRERYLDAVRHVLRALREVTAARSIVDASKYATDAWLLSTMPDVRVHAIHLVRDSRAVAHSWRRPKRRPEIYWREARMELMSPSRSSFHWASMNAAMEAAGTRVDRYDRIRYEDLVRDPIGTLTPLLPDGAREALTALVAEEGVRRTTGHSFSGNPLRFESEPLRIRADDEWLRAMGDDAFRRVTAMTWPLLVHYGYPLSRPDWARAFGGAPEAPDGRRTPAPDR